MTKDESLYRHAKLRLATRYGKDLTRPLHCPECKSRLYSDGVHLWCGSCSYGKKGKLKRPPLDPSSLYLGRFAYDVDANGCWNCTSHRFDKDGYPVTRSNGKSLSASRHVYQELNGELPTEIVVRHTCDNPRCINPDHLITGTQADNIKDRDERGHGPQGEKNGMAKLNAFDVLRIRKKLRETIATLAKTYGVQPRAIADIATNKLWKHVA